MAVVSNSGYTGVAKRMTYESTEGTSSRVWNYMAIGTGAAGTAGMSDAMAQTVATMAGELTANVTGLSRVTVATSASTEGTAGRTVVQSTLAGDTSWYRNTWTCGITGPIATGVLECAIFNSSAGGDMLAYGTFPTQIPMGTGDTLQVTWSVQAKAGA
jgi:hypothetical protein